MFVPDQEYYRAQQLLLGSMGRQCISLVLVGLIVYVVLSDCVRHAISIISQGEYAVDLDGLTTTASGYSNNLTFNITLFSATDLDDTEHQVVLKNMFSSPAAAWVDLNYVVVTSGDGNPLYVLSAFPVPNNTVICDNDLGLNQSISL